MIKQQFILFVPYELLKFKHQFYKRCIVSLAITAFQSHLLQELKYHRSLDCVTLMFASTSLSREVGKCFLESAADRITHESYWFCFHSDCFMKSALRFWSEFCLRGNNPCCKWRTQLKLSAEYPKKICFSS